MNSINKTGLCMRKIIALILLSHILLATRCVTKQMRDNTIVVSNQLNQEVFLLPYKIKYDYYDISFSKQRIISNYAVNPISERKIFHTAFCIKNTWKSVVVGDTLEILVFNRDALEKEKTLEELVSAKSYIRKIKLTYDKLIADSCKVIIE